MLDGRQKVKITNTQLKNPFCLVTAGGKGLTGFESYPWVRDQRNAVYLDKVARHGLFSSAWNYEVSVDPILAMLVL